MRLAKRSLLLISILVVLISLTGVPNTDIFKSEPKVAKNLFNGLPGTNNQILVVKVDDTKYAHPQIGIEDADIVYVEQVEGGLTRLAVVYTSKLPPQLLVAFWIEHRCRQSQLGQIAPRAQYPIFVQI